MLARRVRYAVLSIGMAGTCLVTACGSSSSSNGEAKKSGQQVATDAAAALGATNAVHLSGQLIDTDTKKPVTVDVQLQSDGTSGTLTLAGQPVQVIAVGGTTYLKAPAAFYESQQASAASAAKLANRWVKDPDSSEFNDFTLSGLSKQLNQPSSGSKINAKVSTGSLDGQQAVIASETDGSKLYVAAKGKPVPLEIMNSAQSKDGSGTLKFTNYGKHQEIKAPSGALDVSSAGA